eukprot:Tamp_26164.p1 GENE.Tamp_26164~~Tamp_26164.p1  ORF type:complete len:118 (-),score=19.29 Tamp_26164:486-839(-)
MQTCRVLLLAALALCLVASAYGDAHDACSEAEQASMVECSAKMTATDDQCEFMKQMAPCIPKCMITDASKKGMEADWKAAGCSGSVPTIGASGSAAGIRASAFTVFVSAAVALVASR